MICCYAVLVSVATATLPAEVSDAIVAMLKKVTLNNGVVGRIISAVALLPSGRNGAVRSHMIP